MKFTPLFGDHLLGEEAGDSEVLARGCKLLETVQTAVSNQDCYMFKNLTKYSDSNQLSVYLGECVVVQ